MAHKINTLLNTTLVSATCRPQRSYAHLDSYKMLIEVLQFTIMILSEHDKWWFCVLGKQYNGGFFPLNCFKGQQSNVPFTVVCCPPWWHEWNAASGATPVQYVPIKVQSHCDERLSHQESRPPECGSV